MEELVKAGASVTAVVRSEERLGGLKDRVRVVIGTVLDMSSEQVTTLVADTDCVVCCLGHRMTLRGMYGPPYRLVTDTCKRLHAAASDKTTFVVLGTVGTEHPDKKELRSTGARIVVSMLHYAVPPMADSHHCLAYFLKQNSPWVIVRPDALHESPPGPYTVSPTLVTNLFDARSTSIGTVGNWIAQLATDDALFATWKQKLPVLLDEASQQ